MTTLVLPARRRGAANWLAGFATMLRYHATRMRSLLVLLAAVQSFTGAGMVLGFSLLYRDIQPEQVLYLATGAVVINLILIGMIVGPQLIAQSQMAGSYEWETSLPVPRSSNAAAWTTLNVALGLPGGAAALVAAWWRFGTEFSVSPLIIPGALLTLVAGTLVGYAYAHTIPNPQLIGAVSQVMIFLVLGFSPVAYPSSNLPAWMASAHRWLPFEPMADIVRAGLTNGLVHHTFRSFVVLSAWTAVCAVVATWAIGRRR